MKRIKLVMLVSALLVAGNWSFLNAQVAIGDVAAPAANSVNPTPAPDPSVDPAQLGGLLVYNKTAAVDAGTVAAIPVGIYYWDSTALVWKLLAEVG